jgi:hypothetical protein
VGVIDTFRIKYGKYHLQKAVNSYPERNSVAINLNEASSVALLYKISEEEDYIKINKFMKYLKSEFGMKKLFFLGYWNDPKNEPSFLQTKLDFDYFSIKNLNWKGEPTGGNIDNFLNEHFDILIDLNDYFNVPIRYLIMKSQSKFKVGRFHEDNKPFFDLLIGQNHDEFEEFCNQIVKYLTMINKK